MNTSLQQLETRHLWMFSLWSYVSIPLLSAAFNNSECSYSVRWFKTAQTDPFNNFRAFCIIRWILTTTSNSHKNRIQKTVYSIDTINSRITNFVLFATLKLELPKQPVTHTTDIRFWRLAIDFSIDWYYDFAQLQQIVHSVVPNAFYEVEVVRIPSLVSC